MADPASPTAHRHADLQQYAVRRAALIDPAQGADLQACVSRCTAPALRHGQRRPGTNPLGTTTHLSVIDASGNSVSLTCTIEQEFGSAVVAPGTGFLLNNEMTDFGNPGLRQRGRRAQAPALVDGAHHRQRGGRPDP